MRSWGSASYMSAIRTIARGIAYAVHVDLQGRGYGEAIARAVVRIAFGEPGLHNVEATAIHGTRPQLACWRRLAGLERRLHRRRVGG